MLSDFCKNIYYTFRPLFIRSRNIDVLCQLVYVLKNEILIEQVSSEGKESFINY